MPVTLALVGKEALEIIDGVEEVVDATVVRPRFQEAIVPFATIMVRQAEARVGSPGSFGGLSPTFIMAVGVVVEGDNDVLNVFHVAVAPGRRGSKVEVSIVVASLVDVVVSRIGLRGLRKGTASTRNTTVRVRITPSERVAIRGNTVVVVVNNTLGICVNGRTVLARRVLNGTALS